MQLRFENPELFWAFLGVALLAAHFLRRWRLSPLSFSWRRSILLTVGFSLCVVGLARPQWGQRLTQRQGYRSNLYLMVDISRSMLAKDIAPSRIDFAIAFCQKLLLQVTGVKVSIFPFASVGFTQLPLTTDLFAASDLLASIHPTATTSQGTDISAAMITLFQQIAHAEENAREKGLDSMPSQVILLSDGESHQPLRDEVARNFRKVRVPIFTVGVGTGGGSMIPLESRFGDHDNIKDADGQSVVTKLHADNLKRLSSLSGGEYFSARFEEVYRLANRLAQNIQMGKLTASFKVDHEYYPIFLALAFSYS